MTEEKPHVPAMQLWEYTNGNVNLTDEDFEHLLFCIDCQTLMNEFLDVLAGLRPANPHQAA